QADVRGFEWHYWNHLRHPSLRTVPLEGGFHRAQQPAFSPDGSRFVAASVVDGRAELRVWDTATGRVVRTLATGLDYFRPTGLFLPPRVAFSPDGKRVALSLMHMKDVENPLVALGLETPAAREGSQREVRV